MDPILVPRPKSVRNPDRIASSLLLAQVDHLHEAEKSLPSKYQSNIFHKAIQTEDEAARYVRAVTEAIHKAHHDAAKERDRRVAAKRRRALEIAAAEAPKKKLKGKSKKTGARNKARKARAKH